MLNNLIPFNLLLLRKEYKDTEMLYHKDILDLMGNDNIFDLYPCLVHIHQQYIV